MDPEQIRAAIDIAGPDLFVSSQPQYSTLWQAPALALAWVLRRDEVATAITGASRPEQVHANAGRCRGARRGGRWSGDRTS